VVRAGLRRLLVTFLIVLGGVAAISATLGALAHRSVPHAVAVGYYLAGVGCLIVGFAFGSRGPTRPEGEDDPEKSRPTAFGFTVSAGRRPRRKATPEERREARLASFGLFMFGVILILLGAVIDPTRRAF
jgi:hypothetical protein